MSLSSTSNCSAIPGMSVPHVRRALSTLRIHWAENTPVNMMRLSNELIEGMTIGQFAYNFVLGHHHKRHKRKG